MSSDTILVILGKITALAVKNGQPLNILENPKFTSWKISREGDVPDSLIAVIGNVSVSFEGYSVYELIELYCALRSGLKVEETTKNAVRETWERAKRAYSNAESSK